MAAGFQKKKHDFNHVAVCLWSFLAEPYKMTFA